MHAPYFACMNPELLYNRFSAFYQFLPLLPQVSFFLLCIYTNYPGLILINIRGGDVRNKYYICGQ
jgi:hypothetical protein